MGMLTPLAWATRLLVPRCLAVPQFSQEGESTPMAFFLGDYCYNPIIMEQTLIFSGLSSFPGRNFWKKERIAFSDFGSACYFSFYGKIILLFEGEGIVDVDRLYPLKPKQPV